MLTLRFRAIFVFLTLAVLAACTEPLMTQGQSENLVVRNISVDVSALSGVTGRQIDVPAEQIGADVKAALEKALARPGPGNADLAVVVQSVKLTSPGAAAAFGGNSKISVLMTITDAKTGDVLLPTREVRGYSDVLRLPGVIGVATSPSRENDYRQTVDGFAQSVKEQIYGDDAAS